MSDYYEGAGNYDRETVRFFDIAHEGAQVRAIIDALAPLAQLHGLNPRSLVVLATDQIARAAARAVTQVREPLPLPVVVTDTLPGYVGALDVVVVVGDAADREDDLRALTTAAQRGAETVLAGPARGPIVDEAPRSTVVVPALPTAMGPSPARTIAVVAAVLDVLTARELDVEAVAQRYRVLADELDAELTAVSPERDEDVNAARQLRAFIRDARVVHTGVTRHGAALAELVATLWSCRGLASGVVSAEELPQALELARGPRAATDDIFHDPFLDGPVELVPLKVVCWAQPDADASAGPNTRAETVASQELGEAAAALRLLARAYAVTALDDPAL